MIGDELWAWQVLEDGEWGTISAVIPGVGHAILVSRSKPIVTEFMRPVAESHAKESGLPVRLARFALAEVVEVLP
jgi:hypothetical protein